MSERPLLLVDVDGVLLVVRSPAEVGDDALEAEPTLHPEARAWFAELAADFEIAWATTWMDLANRLVGPALGLPALPAVDFDLDHRAPTPKLRSVIACAGDRAIAWIDDDLHEDAFTWAAGRAAPTLLVRVDPAQGMGRRDVERLLAWADGLRAVR